MSFRRLFNRPISTKHPSADSDSVYDDDDAITTEMEPDTSSCDAEVVTNATNFCVMPTTDSIINGGNGQPTKHRGDDADADICSRMSGNDGNAADNEDEDERAAGNEEEKHDIDSEKHNGKDHRRPSRDELLIGAEMKIDSIVLQRAFETLKQENAELQEKLEQERRNTILLKPRYDYLEAHFIEYVQTREEFKVRLEQIEEERNRGPMIKPSMDAKETQTWKGIICSYCSKTHEIANNKLFKDFVECQTKNSLCISSKTYRELEQKFKALKDAIKTRETIYENRAERAEIINLKAAVAQSQARMAHVMRKNQHGQYCLETLQQIIVKLTGQIEHMEAITVQEQHWIEQIVSKFEDKSTQPMCPVSLTPSAIDFTKPNCTTSGGCPAAADTHHAAAGDF